MTIVGIILQQVFAFELPLLLHLWGEEMSGTLTIGSRSSLSSLDMDLVEIELLSRHRLLPDRILANLSRCCPQQSWDNPSSGDP